MSWQPFWSMPNLPKLDSLWTTDGQDTHRVFHITCDRHGWRISCVKESGPKRITSEWPAAVWPKRFKPKEPNQ